jgi:hypothetical protein
MYIHLNVFGALKLNHIVKVLKNGRGHGRVKVFTVSAVTDAALQIAVVAV